MIAALHRNQSVIEFDLEGFIRSANENFCALMGFVESEIVGEHHTILCPPDYTKTHAYIAFWQRLAAGRVESGEFMRIAKDGSTVWLQATYNPILDPDGTPVSVATIASDISALKQREAELALANERALRFDALNASISDWLWEADAEGRFTYLSENFKRFVGEEPSSYIGKDRNTVVIRYADEDEASRINALIKARKPFRDLEFQRHTADNRLIWVRTSGVPVFSTNGVFNGYRGAGSDITEQMVLRERRSQLATLFDTLPLGVMLLDKDLTIVLLNKNMAGVLGRSYPSIAVGSPLRDLTLAAIRSGEIPVADGQTEEFLRERFEVIRSKPTEVERERNGRAIEVRSVPLGDGSVLFYELDVSDRRTLRSQLIHSQRLEAIGGLTAGVAHDFNNTLAVIQGNLELLAAARNADEAQMHVDALNAVEKGARLTRQLLAFARQSTLETTVVNINAFVQGIDRILRRTLPESIQIETVTGGGLWDTEIDVAQAESALLNLALNSRDAMPEGGRLTIETANTRIGPEYIEERHEELRPGRYVLLAVTDTGVGMPPDVLERAFEPFFTTKPVGKGTGMGLATIYGLMHQFNGTARIYSEEGIGTTVKLFFPASAVGAAPPTTRKLAEIEAGTERVLLVEDNDQLRKVLERQVRSLGYSVMVAESGDAALELLNNGLVIDLLVTDIVMPGGLMGTHLAKRARGLMPALPVVFLSGYPTEANVHGNGVDPQDAIVMKPASLETLSREMRRALNRRAADGI